MVATSGPTVSTDAPIKSRRRWMWLRRGAGGWTVKGYRRLLRTKDGGRQAYLAEELVDRLQDRDWLAAMPAGSVGAHYLALCRERDPSACGLSVQGGGTANVDVSAAHPHHWYVRRLRDVNGIWYVLTGYRTDALGQACMAAFSVPQTGNAVSGLMAWSKALHSMDRRTGHPCGRAVLQAWRLGRRAKWLPALDYASLLSEPLETARARLRIGVPDIYLSIPREVCGATKQGVGGKPAVSNRGAVET